EQLGVAFEGPWVCDRTSGVRNVYPDLSWTYHELPGGLHYQNVDRGGFDAALRARLRAVGGRIAWDHRGGTLDVRADEVVVRTAEGDERRAPLVIDAAGRHAPSPRLFKLKTEDPEFRQIAIALFFSELPDAAVGFWDRHLYGERGATISGARIRPGLFRLRLGADLGDKHADRGPPADRRALGDGPARVSRDARPRRPPAARRRRDGLPVAVHRHGLRVRDAD